MKTIQMDKPKEFMERGQALTELAIFGSILLFFVAVLVQYGLQANYQQQVQMEAFRKAQKMAFYKSGPNATVSLVVVKNKAFPDPRDQFGFAERSPVAAGESVVWDTNQSSQYVKKFNEKPKEEDLPAMYFEIDGVNRESVVDKTNGTKIKDVAKAPVPAGENKVFGFYTARFEKIACPEEVTVVFDDRTHKDPRNKNGTEYFPVRVKKEDIWVARIEGEGFGEEEIKTNPDYALLMYPYFRDKGDASLLKQRITDADVDGDGKLEAIIGADKDKNLFYIRYHNSNAAGSPEIVAGAIQVDTTYSQVEPGDKVCISWDYDTQNCTAWKELGPEDRQGMIRDFTKTSKHLASMIEKTESAGAITSKTTLNAKQTINHEFRLNGGQKVIVPAEVTVNNNNLYNWGKK